MGVLVSILIPCFNAERWIARAIESASSQRWPDKETIVVDDGSTDGSLEVIRRYEDRLRWETGPNRGGNATRNQLLELARGEWLQYLDADDYLLPNKIERQLDFLAAHPDTDIVFGPVTIEHFDEKDSKRELLPIPEPHDPWILLARWFLPQTGAVLWRKQATIDVGGWKEDQPCCQEHELYLRLLIAGKRFAYCPDEGAVYRQLRDSTVSTSDLSKVHEQRLEIQKEAEHVLGERGELSSDRLRAINDGRFEVARMVRVYNTRRAEEVIATIKRSD